MFTKRVCLLLICVASCFFNVYADIERRAAFDIGSGSIKLLIADIDSETQTLKQYVFSKSIKVPLSEDLAKSDNQRFSAEIQQRVKIAIHELKQIAEDCGTERYFGVATEAFRLAQNGEELVSTVIQDENFTIRIINQKEEAELGFTTLIVLSESNPEDAVVWDIGSGSFQVSWKNENQIYSYAKKIGKALFKNMIISKVQKKIPSLVVTPNPISENQAKLAKFLLIEELGEIPENLKLKMQNPATEVYGIGAIHDTNIGASSEQIIYTRQTVDALLAERLNLPDSAFAINKPEFWVSDLIFVSAVMSHLNITSVINIQAVIDSELAASGNAIGILVHPEYWSN